MNDEEDFFKGLWGGTKFDFDSFRVSESNSVSSEVGGGIKSDLDGFSLMDSGNMGSDGEVLGD